MDKKIKNDPISSKITSITLKRKMVGHVRIRSGCVKFYGDLFLRCRDRYMGKTENFFNYIRQPNKAPVAKKYEPGQ